MSGFPAYAPDPNVSLKATSHLTAPAPTGNRAPLQGVRPVHTTVPGIEWEGHPTDPRHGCGEEGDERRYGRHIPKRMAKRRLPKRMKKGRRRRRGKAKAARGECDDLYDKTKPLGGDEYLDCVLELLR